MIKYVVANTIRYRCCYMLPLKHLKSVTCSAVVNREQFQSSPRSRLNAISVPHNCDLLVEGLESRGTDKRQDSIIHSLPPQRRDCGRLLGG